MPIAGNNHRERLIHSRNLPDIESNPLNAQRERASWRGWLIGLLAISGVSAAIPYADFVLRGTPLSYNAFPMIPVVLILFLSAVLFWCRNIFGLSRQDLTLIYCMTSISYAIPGIGFWWAWSTGMTGAYFHASPENNWAEIIHPHLSAGFFPRDPVDPFDPAPRPIEWFYTGLPMGKTIPWLAWLGPYSRWCLVVMCMNGIWFSLATLLYPRWSRQERLPFPIAQIPAELIQLGKGGPDRRSFFQENRPLIWGILLTFSLQSWNSLHSYVSNVPEIPLRFENLHTKIFSEPPWRDIGGLDVNVFPSVIGLTYLLSMEVGFSLWFFYVLKLVLNFFFAGRVGAPALDEAYQAQGTGALLALSWFMAWMARRDLWHSLRQALGKESWDDDDGWHPMWTWLLLAISIAGAIAWLLWAGVDWRWAVSILFLFITVVAGLSRLIAETGICAAQLYDFPVYLLSMTATPALLGSKNLVMLTIWDRVFTADWFRIVPMPGILTAFHLSESTGLRRRTVVSGLVVAIVVTMVISFFSFLSTAYYAGGAGAFGWFFDTHPTEEFSRLSHTVARVDAWKSRETLDRKNGGRIPPQEIPEVARPDYFHIAWIAGGAITATLFALLRRYLFWWPHPAGYVMWMAYWPHRSMWFSFFLGWILKAGIAKYGGFRINALARRFFIGLVVGEALAAILWTVIAWLTDHQGARLW